MLLNLLTSHKLTFKTTGANQQTDEMLHEIFVKHLCIKPYNEIATSQI